MRYNMTDVKERRSLFQANSSPASVEKKRKPPPPPKAPLMSAHLNRVTTPMAGSVAASSQQRAAERTSFGEKPHRLDPSLLKKLEQGGGGLSPVSNPSSRAGGPKAKSLSPALGKKSRSAGKLPAKHANGGAPGDVKPAEPTKLGLLASVTREMSASTGNLDSDAPSSTSPPSKRRPSPPSFHGKSTSPKKSRKAAALSMMDTISAAVVSKLPRPASTGSPHRITSRWASNGQHSTTSEEVSPTHRPSPLALPPSGNSPFTRSRNDSFDSFEDSYSPPPSRRSPSSPRQGNTSTLHQPAKLSRSTENLLEDDRPIPRGTTKPRSSSECVAPGRPGPRPPLKKKPKPAVPPKKPGLLSKPAPPPKPSCLNQLKKTPQQVRRRVVSPPHLAPTDEPCSKGAIPKVTSPTIDMSPPPLISFPNSPATPLGQEDVPSVISPHPSTPSPRTSQLEAVRRNADSGFASETAEDPSSPIETVHGTDGSREGEGGGEGEGGEGGKRGEEKGEEEAESPPVEVWDEARVEKARNKRLHIAEELLKTEATYVERLHMIAVKFHGAVREFNSQHKNIIPDSDVNRIFLNISQIHHLNTNIHEELQQRMDTWSTQEGLGDVIERLAPFLKLYAHYTAGFEDAMKMLTRWTRREKKFYALVRNFEMSELSTGLGVAHYMLEPVQRIPRYRLLLADYLKNTPPDSPDRQPTEKALGIISEAADHSNDRIKDLENSNTILSIQRSLQDHEGTLLAPGRLFIHKGQLEKFSRKTKTPRMFFLFSDMLLHTEPTGTDVYKFKNEMPLHMMRVEEPVASLVAHSFNVESTTRSLILVASSEVEKREWMTVLRRAITEDETKRKSLRREMSVKVTPGVFGAQAPIMVPDKSVTMCQTCSAIFTFTFRRHHCRGCGKVVCGGCSQWKAYLAYLKRCERVCEKCYFTAKSAAGEAVDAALPSPVMSKKKVGAGGILDLKGYEEDTIKGGYVLSQEGRKWNRLWYQLKQDFCLYKFRAHEDIKAMSSLPLPGYIVKSDQDTHTITLIHPSSKKELSDTFRLESLEDFNIWVLALESVVLLELPSLPAPGQQLSPPPPTPSERSRSQSLRDVNSIDIQEDSSLEKSI